MNITNHWLEGIIKDEITGGSPMNVRRVLVMHFTSGATAKSSIDYMRKIGLSCHIVIDREGSIYQCRPFNKECAHAGVSRWIDPNTGKKYVGVNSCSIGIEMANAGEDEVLAKKWTKLPLVKAKHRNGGPLMNWEDFPQTQIESASEVATVLLEKYHLDDITGHDCIAPERKVDPGPAFPMKEFRESLGFMGLPKVHFK